MRTSISYCVDWPEAMINRHVCEPETKEAGGWDCGGRWLMDVFRLSKDHMLGFFHAEVSRQTCSTCHLN